MTAEKQSALQTIEEKRDLVIEIADKYGNLRNFPFRNSSQQKPIVMHWKRKALK